MRWQHCRQFVLSHEWQAFRAKDGWDLGLMFERTGLWTDEIQEIRAQRVPVSCPTAGHPVWCAAGSSRAHRFLKRLSESPGFPPGARTFGKGEQSPFCCFSAWVCFLSMRRLWMTHSSRAMVQAREGRQRFFGGKSMKTRFQTHICSNIRTQALSVTCPHVVTLCHVLPFPAEPSTHLPSTQNLPQNQFDSYRQAFSPLLG